MNIKLSLSLLIFTMTTLTTSHAAKTAESKTYNVDSKASSLKWVGTKITGKHDGTVTISKGALTLVDSEITGGNFEVDMGSIAVSDIPDAETNAKLVGHLKSDDFFNSAKFPNSTFVIKKVTALKNAKESATHEISGDLTVKGVTQPLSFPAKVTVQKDSVTATADIKIDRTKWNIKYGSGKFFKGLGDKAIHDEFTLVLNLVTKK